MNCIPYEDMKFVWIASFWDGPIEGLCKFDGQVMHFREAGANGTYRVSPLTPIRKARWLLRKFLFELCVGKHYSYPHRTNGVHFHWRRPIRLHKALFSAYYKFLQPMLKESA